MLDQTTTISEIKTRLRSFVEERDWSQFHAPKNLSMAIAAEAAELMEHFLWVDSNKSGSLLQDPEKAIQIREELADILIYALEFADVAGIDVAEAIALKLERNAINYPIEKSRGKSLKYTEL